MRRHFNHPPRLLAAMIAVVVALAAVPAGAQGMDPYDGPGGMAPGGPDDMGPGGMGPGPGGMGPGGMGPGPGGMGPGDMGPDDGPPGRGGRGMRGMRNDMDGGGGMDGGRMGGRGMGGDVGDMSEHAVTIGGRQRTYYVHLPQNVAHPAPLVIMFHGGNGRPRGIARKTGWNALADQNGFIVVYPEGSPTRSGRGGTWNVGDGVGMSATSADDMAYVRAIIADVRRNAQVDPARIYAAGHSMGGVFSYRLACEMSGTFAAIGVVSSTMVEKGCTPTSPVAVLHIHGSADDRIPLAGGHGAETAQDRSWPRPQAGVTTWARLDACAPQPSRRHGRRHELRDLRSLPRHG